MSHIIIRAYLQKEPLDCLVLCPHQIASAKFWGEKVIRILAAPCWNSTKLAKSAMSLVFLMYCFETYSPCMNGWNIGVFKVCWNIGNFQHLENSFTKLDCWKCKLKLPDLIAIQFLSFVGIATSSKAGTPKCQLDFAKVGWFSSHLSTISVTNF